MLRAADLGSTSSGVWTRPQALTVMTSGQIQAALVRQTLQSPFNGVYADGGYALDPVQWATAAVLASGGADQPVPFGEPDDQGERRRRLRAVACGRSAARVWGFPLVDDDDPATGGLDRFVHDVHVWRRLADLRQAPVDDDPRGHELRRHTLTLHSGDLVRHESGLWLTGPLPTALTCCLLLTHEAAVCVLDDGLHRGLFTPADLDAALEARTGSPGSLRQGAVLADADGRAEAPSESLARLVLKPVLPRLVPQVELRDRRGHVVARFDLGDEEIKLAFDVDGKRGHAGSEMVAKDRGRDRRTRPYGWWTERTTWFEVRRQQAQLQDRAVALDAERRRRAA